MCVRVRKSGFPDPYEGYQVTQAAFTIGGKWRTDWSKMLHQLAAMQTTEGCEAGSWSTEAGTTIDTSAGRLLRTAMSCLTSSK